ncbi:MAG: SAM-dependent methyltransferase [Actinomycetota bacterium]
MTPVDAAVRALIERQGPIHFDEVVRAALYDSDGGFYSGSGRAGRGGDFITSPEVGPLFGAVVARALDAWWTEAGEPSAFVVVEAGAGPGTLALMVMRAQPRCLPALRYVLVETSDAQRARHTEHLALAEPLQAFVPSPAPDDDEPVTALPPGPIFVSVAEMPRITGPCVVLANELLDNLPFGLAERGDDGWNEVLVGLDGVALREVHVPLAPDEVARLERLAPSAERGARVPLQRAAREWLRDAMALAGTGGRVVVLDYGATTAELADRPQEEWLRTYRQHERGTSPLDALGTQDITCELAIDQLDLAPTCDRSQAEWLRSHGIDELVEQGRRTWQERASTGDLAAMVARSRVNEAEALLDPAGLGAFRVLEWHR